MKSDGLRREVQEQEMRLAEQDEEVLGEGMLVWFAYSPISRVWSLGLWRIVSRFATDGDNPPPPPHTHTKQIRLLHKKQQEMAEKERQQHCTPS
jgi:hypothetical protein